MNKELVFIYHLRKPIWKYHVEVVSGKLFAVNMFTKRCPDYGIHIRLMFALPLGHMAQL